VSTHKPELSELSITQLHELTGKARETITKRLEGRLKPTRRDGRTIYYSPRAALPLIYLDEEQLDPGQERAKFDRSRNEGQELKNAVDRAELVPASAVVRTWAAKVVMVKSRMRALPAQAAALIPGFTAAMARRLAELIERALTDLADDNDSERGPPPRGPVAPRR